jgi:cell division protein FtsZ
MSIKLQSPTLTDLKPRISVMGVGGAGGNAINNMISAGLSGVEFIVANTDAQALAASSAEHRIQLGVNLTEGLGAGSKPEIGEAAAEEAIDEIRARISGSHMLFLAAGMGGGTGTGATAVIARVAKELNILTVAVVTKPFQFEGSRRMRAAEAGVAELKKHVDTIMVIPNQNLFRIATGKTTFAEAFMLADQVLYSGIACITDLIVKDGLINLDLADVRTVLYGMGSAVMGTGESAGERRAVLAAEQAIVNPLIDDLSLRGAKGLLISIIGGQDMTLYEVDEAVSRVRQEVDPDANIIVGATFDQSLGDKVRVSIVASGMALSDGEKPALGALAAPPSWSGSSERPAAPRQQQQGGEANGGAMPPQAAHAAEAREDFQRRLSDAIGRTPTPANESLVGANAVSVHDRSRPLEVWRAPGNVFIHEETPLFVGQMASPRSNTFPITADPISSPRADEFTPAPPAEIRRERRMPKLEDFPIVGQRDYRAKTARQSEGISVAEPQQRKTGLLERITGVARSRRDQPHDKKPAAGAHDANSGRDQIEPPKFFGRGKR